MSDPKYKTLGDADFENEVLKSPQPVLVDFWAPWCGPCQAMAPAVEQIAVDFDGIAKVGKINVDDNPHVATALGVRSIPTLMIFKNGRVVDQVVGLVQKRVLADKLTAAIESV